jgi:hypothetical protein
MRAGYHEWREARLQSRWKTELCDVLRFALSAPPISPLVVAYDNESDVVPLCRLPWRCMIRERSSSPQLALDGFVDDIDLVVG